MKTDCLTLTVVLQSMFCVSLPHIGAGFSCTPDKDIRFYPGIENIILPMLSYPGSHVRASYIGCIGALAHGRQVASLLCLSDVIM